MVTKNKDRSPRQQFVFTYKGKTPAVVEVVVDTLEKAQRGRANAQQSILFKYKKQAGFSKAAVLLWNHVAVEPVEKHDVQEGASS